MACALLCGTPVLGQPTARQSARDVGWQLAANATVGVVVSLIRAAFSGKSWRRAALRGAIGGGIHGVGKLMYVRESALAAHVGNGISALGASVVVNAAASDSWFAGANVPIGPLRVVIRQDSAGNRARLRFNIADGVVALHLLARKDLATDSRESLRRSTLVLRSDELLLVRGEGSAQGASAGSVAIISRQSVSPPATLRHELSHVQQRRFLQDVIGRPAELALARRVGVQHWWPDWLEVGVVPSLLLIGEKRLSPRGHGPLRHVMEKEAVSLSRCPIYSANCP